MQFHVNYRIIVLILIFLISAVPLSEFCFALEKYGIIIVTDSSNANVKAMTSRIDKFIVRIREKNKDIFDKDMLWVKPYDYNNSAHVEFIRTVLGVSKNEIPFVGLALLNDDQTFKSYLPGMKLVDVKDSKQAAEKIMERFKNLLPTEEQRKKFLAKLTGFEKITADPPDSDIYINGKLVGKTPMTDILLEPGDYTIKISKSGMADFEKTVKLDAGDFGSINAKLEEAKSRITFNSIPPGAFIKVDNVDRGKTPITLELSPGTHTVSLTKDGFKDFFKSFEVRANSNQTEIIRMEAKKVKCYLEVKGYYIQVRRPIGFGKFEIITLTVDPDLLWKKMKDLLSKQEVIEITANKSDAKFNILYEATPTEAELSGILKVTNSKTGEKVLDKSAKVRSSSTSDEELVDLAVKLFEANLLPSLNETIQQFNQ